MDIQEQVKGYTTFEVFISNFLQLPPLCAELQKKAGISRQCNLDENKGLKKFIVDIQQQEAIWNCEGAAYKNRDLKRRQWEDLVDTLGKEEMMSFVVFGSNR
ncbi:hypothetical protein FQA39_LY09506 [Lamprigera yunnana]|nr:hypothetical protein FQA39_LY09506 [Lamprigera yunnana]